VNRQHLATSDVRCTCTMLCGNCARKPWQPQVFLERSLFMCMCCSPTLCHFALCLCSFLRAEASNCHAVRSCRPRDGIPTYRSFDWPSSSRDGIPVQTYAGSPPMFTLRYMYRLRTGNSTSGKFQILLFQDLSNELSTIRNLLAGVATHAAANGPEKLTRAPQPSRDAPRSMVLFAGEELTASTTFLTAR